MSQIGCNCGKKKRLTIMDQQSAQTVVDQSEAAPELPPEVQDQVERSASA